MCSFCISFIQRSRALTLPGRQCPATLPTTARWIDARGGAGGNTAIERALAANAIGGGDVCSQVAWPHRWPPWGSSVHATQRMHGRYWGGFTLSQDTWTPSIIITTVPWVDAVTFAFIYGPSLQRCELTSRVAGNKTSFRCCPQCVDADPSPLHMLQRRVYRHYNRGVKRAQAVRHVKASWSMMMLMLMINCAIMCAIRMIWVHQHRAGPAPSLSPPPHSAGKWPRWAAVRPRPPVDTFLL